MPDNRTQSDLAAELSEGYKAFCEKWPGADFDVFNKHDSDMWGPLVYVDEEGNRQEMPENIREEAKTYFPALVEKINHMSIAVSEGPDVGLITQECEYMWGLDSQPDSSPPGETALSPIGGESPVKMSYGIAHKWPAHYLRCELSIMPVRFLSKEKADEAAGYHNQRVKEPGHSYQVVILPNDFATE